MKYKKEKKIIEAKKKKKKKKIDNPFYHSYMRGINFNPNFAI